MPPPAEIRALIQPSPEAFAPGWADEFGPYSWCYVAGFEKTCAALSLRDNTAGRTELNAMCADAVKAILPDWKNFFTDPNTRLDGWNSLSSKQYRTAFKNDPMRLDKAVLIVTALDLYSKKIGKPVDVWNTTSIRPSIFKIDGFDKKTYNAVVRPLLVSSEQFMKDMLAATYQRSVSVFSGLSENRPVTHKTAQLILDFLSSRPETKRLSIGPVVQVDSRIDVPDKKPCSSQVALHI